MSQMSIENREEFGPDDLELSFQQVHEVGGLAEVDQGSMIQEGGSVGLPCRAACLLL